MSCVWFWFLPSSIPELNSPNRLKLLIILKTLRAAKVARVMGTVPSVPAWGPEGRAGAQALRRVVSEAPPPPPNPGRKQSFAGGNVQLLSHV